MLTYFLPLERLKALGDHWACVPEIERPGDGSVRLSCNCETPTLIEWWPGKPTVEEQVVFDLCEIIAEARKIIIDPKDAAARAERIEVIAEKAFRITVKKEGGTDGKA